MRVARVVGWIGRLMMSAGVILLLFVAFQLWGTGIRAAQEQEQLEDQFAAMQEDAQDDATAGADTTAPPDTSAPDPNTTDTSTTDTSSPEGTAPTTAAPPPDGTVPATTAQVPILEPGDPVGRIMIDEIGVDWIVIEGVPLSLLRKGPGHFPGTPLPGQAGNAAIAGHRTTWGAPFNRIDELVAGDLIEVETYQGTFFYEVFDQPAVDGQAPSAHAIVRPWETELIEPTDDDIITLVACHPEYSARQRIIVQGRLTSAPAPSTPEASVAPADGENAMLGDDLSGGDGSAWPAAVGFGLAAAGVWLGAWLIARRWGGWRTWRTWATYGVALVPFLLLLFFCFENVNRLLPAAY